MELPAVVNSDGGSGTLSASEQTSSKWGSKVASMFKAIGKIKVKEIALRAESVAFHVVGGVLIVAGPALLVASLVTACFAPPIGLAAIIGSMFLMPGLYIFGAAFVVNGTNINDCLNVAKRQREEV
jgi:hypothetical protein